jgi:hypothetical protein
MAMIENSGFDYWLQRVNAYLVRKCGLGSDDLPDWCYRDAFDDGYTPSEAAREVIRAARDY